MGELFEAHNYLRRQNRAAGMRTEAQSFRGTGPVKTGCAVVQWPQFFFPSFWVAAPLKIRSKPKKGFPFFSRVTEELSERTAKRHPGPRVGSLLKNTLLFSRSLKGRSFRSMTSHLYLDSLPELVDFKLFGKTILVANTKFNLFLASQLGK